MLKLRSTSNQSCFEHHRRLQTSFVATKVWGLCRNWSGNKQKNPCRFILWPKRAFTRANFDLFQYFKVFFYLHMSKYHTNLDLETKISATGRWLTIPDRMLNIIFLVVVNHDKTANRRIQLSPAVRIFAPGQKLVLARYSNLFKFVQVFRRWWPWPKTRKGNLIRRLQRPIDRISDSRRFLLTN